MMMMNMMIELLLERSRFIYQLIYVRIVGITFVGALFLTGRVWFHLLCRVIFVVYNDDMAVPRPILRKLLIPWVYVNVVLGFA